MSKLWCQGSASCSVFFSACLPLPSAFSSSRIFKWKVVVYRLKAQVGDEGPPSELCWSAADIPFGLRAWNEWIRDAVCIWMALAALCYIWCTSTYLDLYVVHPGAFRYTPVYIWWYPGTPLARTQTTLVSIWEHSCWRQPPHPHPLIIRVPHPTPHLSPLSLPNTFTTIQNGPQTPWSAIFLYMLVRVYKRGDHG